MIPNHPDRFVNRHIGPSPEALEKMLEVIKAKSLDKLINEVVPKGIRSNRKLKIGQEVTEFEYLRQLKKVAAKNKVFRSYIGMGYYGTLTPTVILRNVMENPGWYTQYTPYQAEIAQGRLEALLNFQTMVSDLTALPIANASLLDEATAAAEGMTMMYGARPKSKDSAHTFLVSDNVFPHTLDVVATRAEPIGIQVKVVEGDKFYLTDDVFGILIQYPGANGSVTDYRALAEEASSKGVKVVVAADLMSLALLAAPGEWGADVCVGNTQRFGVPMGYGGPHAAFFATKEEYLRQIPGRIIGVSVDRFGNNALRMALQTREQHIRRDKATSNICTAQALLAIMASMYAVYHGPKGIQGIASRIHSMANALNNALSELGFKQTNKSFFDTLCIDTKETESIQKAALAKKINLFYGQNEVRIALDETMTLADLKDLVAVFAIVARKSAPAIKVTEVAISERLKRNSPYFTHPIFNEHHSESQMLRYLKRLENKDLSLAHSMIALGSCTMKLNATTEMMPVTWTEFGGLHPFCPIDQAQGYAEIFRDLEKWLCDITGFDACSLQPNSGAQGEYAGLLAIRAYHQATGGSHRNIALIPASAHGTNPASAVMVGMKVVVTACDAHGNVDINDLREKAILHADNLACLMVTYPSTHGVYEEGIQEICSIIHQHGGKVYMDGANMNAQVGLTSPGDIGADVCHLNLHKTFAIPHGGGGPGMGPICVNASLAPYLPKHTQLQIGDGKGIKAVSSAPFGSASILLISYAYIKMLGASGITEATKFAILNANYIKTRLEKAYPILYTGNKGYVAHELIVDLRDFKKLGIEAEDVAKRLMDFGFHAPTLSFPVAGTIMIEPTESEDKAELDRFCDALLQIRKEIDQIATGNADATDNVLKNAPHPLSEICATEWNHPYSREDAAFALPFIRDRKFWPSIARVNNTHGDRNVVCTCLPIEAYS